MASIEPPVTSAEPAYVVTIRHFGGRRWAVTFRGPRAFDRAGEFFERVKCDPTALELIFGCSRGGSVEFMERFGRRSKFGRMERIDRDEGPLPDPDGRPTKKRGT
jgi:hypothetical protein